MSKWIKRPHHSVSGLTKIGFVPNSEVLLVLSNQGRNLYDCRTNFMIASDKSSYSFEEHYYDCRVKGIDKFCNLDILVGGFDHPEVLSETSTLNWSITSKEYNNNEVSQYILILEKGCESQVIFNSNSLTDKMYGFSDSGKSFVLALPHELYIFNLDYGHKYENIDNIYQHPEEAMRLWALSTDTIFADQDEDLLFYNDDCIMALINLYLNPSNLKKVDTLKIISGYLNQIDINERAVYDTKISQIDIDGIMMSEINEMINRIKNHRG